MQLENPGLKKKSSKANQLQRSETPKFFRKGKGKNANELAPALALMLEHNKETSPSYQFPAQCYSSWLLIIHTSSLIKF